MEPTVIATIISVFGGAVIGLFIYFIRSVSTKIDKLDEKVNTKIDKLDEKVDTKIDKLDEKVDTKIDKLEKKVDNLAGELCSKINALTASVAAVAATQAEHGIKLQHMMGHGERISALEGATFGTAAT